MSDGDILGYIGDIPIIEDSTCTSDKTTLCISEPSDGNLKYIPKWKEYNCK